MSDSSVNAKALPRATIEIIGIPGTAVAVFPETPLDAPPAPIFEGELSEAGRLRLRVPRAALLVVAVGFGNKAVQFVEGEDFLRVDVRPTGSPP